MLEFKVLMPGDDLFDDVTRLCEESYWNCNLLDEECSFNENPDHYCIVRCRDVIVATLGVFVKTAEKPLPIDGVMLYPNDSQGMVEIELGRLSFIRKPRTKKDLIEILSITRFLFKNLYFHAEEKFGSYVIYFETYKTIIKLLKAAFGNGFIIPLKSFLVWDRIPEERKGFYSKFSGGDAGLFQVDLNLFREAIGIRYGAVASA